MPCSNLTNLHYILYYTVIIEVIYSGLNKITKFSPKLVSQKLQVKALSVKIFLQVHFIRTTKLHGSA